MEMEKKKKIGDRRDSRRERGEQAEDFQGSEITVCDATTVDPCHYTLVKTHRMYDAHSEC